MQVTNTRIQALPTQQARKGNFENDELENNFSSTVKIT
jgi:hypothetical protein